MIASGENYDRLCHGGAGTWRGRLRPGHRRDSSAAAVRHWIWVSTLLFLFVQLSEAHSRCNGMANHSSSNGSSSSSGIRRLWLELLDLQVDFALQETVPAQSVSNPTRRHLVLAMRAPRPLLVAMPNTGMGSHGMPRMWRSRTFCERMPYPVSSPLLLRNLVHPRNGPWHQTSVCRRGRKGEVQRRSGLPQRHRQHGLSLEISVQSSPRTARKRLAHRSYVLFFQKEKVVSSTGD